MINSDNKEVKDFEIVLGNLVKCNLKSDTIVIPSEVLTIGPMVFKDNVNLKSVQLNYGLKRITMAAFSECENLTNLVIPDTVISIGADAFKDCTSLRSVSFGKRLSKIGDKAFYGCCELQEVNLPSTIRVLGKYAFANCGSLTSVQLSNFMKKIDDGCFKGCLKLDTIRLPDNLKKLGKNAFMQCHSLHGITIPLGVKTIRAGTFADCISLRNLVFKDTSTIIEEDAFSNTPSLKEFYSNDIRFKLNQSMVGDNLEMHLSNLNNLASYEETPQNFTIADIAYLMEFNCTQLLNKVSPYFIELVKDMIELKKRDKKFKFDLKLKEDEESLEDDTESSSRFKDGTYVNNNLNPRWYIDKNKESNKKIIEAEDNKEKEEIDSDAEKPVLPDGINHKDIPSQYDLYQDGNVYIKDPPLHDTPYFSGYKSNPINSDATSDSIIDGIPVIPDLPTLHNKESSDNKLLSQQEVNKEFERDNDDISYYPPKLKSRRLTDEELKEHPDLIPQLPPSESLTLPPPLSPSESLESLTLPPPPPLPPLSLNDADINNDESLLVTPQLPKPKSQSVKTDCDGESTSLFSQKSANKIAEIKNKKKENNKTDDNDTELF